MSQEESPGQLEAVVHLHQRWRAPLFCGFYISSRSLPCSSFLSRRLGTSCKIWNIVLGSLSSLAPGVTSKGTFKSPNTQD